MRCLGAAVAIAALVSGCNRPATPTVAPVTAVVQPPQPPREPPPSLLGTKPPDWPVTEWVNAEPLRLADLRGKVVLVRWFTGPWCPDCSATAPALREFDERYRDMGLAVVGMFHNSDTAMAAEVRGHLDTYKYRFPVAIDRKAAARLAWSGGRDDYGFTSASFLLDREGSIRYIHEGGRYVKGDATYLTLESEIERLLSEVPGEGVGH
jgi:peroxiredoxin